MSDSEKGLCYFIVGVLCTIVFWLMFADIIERHKVDSGFLTYENKIYKVELYDTLDVPEKE